MLATTHFLATFIKSYALDHSVILPSTQRPTYVGTTILILQGTVRPLPSNKGRSVGKDGVL